MTADLHVRASSFRVVDLTAGELRCSFAHCCRALSGDTFGDATQSDESHMHPNELFPASWIIHHLGTNPNPNPNPNPKLFPGNTSRAIQDLGTTHEKRQFAPRGETHEIK